MPIGDGNFYLYLHGDVRKASGTQVGDVVNVQIRFDHGYKGGPAPVMPVWFAAALKRQAPANRGWKRLTPSRQKEIARYLSGLKSDAAQRRNLQNVLGMLADD